MVHIRYACMVTSWSICLCAMEKLDGKKSDSNCSHNAVNESKTSQSPIGAGPLLRYDV